MSVHAIERAEQRYNMNLSWQDMNILVQKIQSMDSMPLDRVNSNKSFHIVELRNIPLKVLYSSKTKKIITIYPFDTDAANKYIEFKKEKADHKRITDIIQAISFLENEGYFVLVK